MNTEMGSQGVPVNPPAIRGFRLVCPICRGAVRTREEAAACPTCDRLFPRTAGIYRFLSAEQQREIAPFLQRYGTVRAAEGWGSAEPGYFRALPNPPANDSHHVIWRQRAQAFRTFCDRGLTRVERELGRSLQVVDLGAGNCWLAHRLAERGHAVAAVDLSDNAIDGLGAWHSYGDPEFAVIQASFDRLPLADGQADLVVFNASLHYAADLSRTFGEALRVLRPGGSVAILDSPFYTRAADGERMVRERDARFTREYGFAEPTRRSVGFLTPERLANLAALWSVRWQTIWPSAWWRRAWRSQIGRLRLGRAPGSFPILVAQQSWPTPRKENK